jgi:hypothetical protein
MPWGTLVNVAAVIIGSLAGILLKRGLPPRFKAIIFQGIGLVTFIIGFQGAMAVDSARHLMEVIFAILLGGMLGEAINIQGSLEKLGEWIKSRTNNADSRFTEGMVTAFLIFCIGPMTIVGSLDEGIRGDASVLFAKSVLDLFMSMALASSLGLGVLFSIIPLFAFQYGITLLGIGAQSMFSEVVIAQMTAVGGVLILGLGIDILELRRLKVANMLPALLFVILFAILFG